LPDLRPASRLFAWEAEPLRWRRIPRPPIFRRISSGHDAAIPDVIRPDVRRITVGISEIYPPDYPAQLPGNRPDASGQCPVQCPAKAVTYPR
jgi:hypothetical protein